MKIVITGATGCLGMALTKQLCQQGAHVCALGRNPNLGKLLTQLGANFIQVDMVQEQLLKKCCQDASIIFHCAALSSPWGKYQDFYNTNVVGTHNVIQATPENARLIHVSSPSIYFDFNSRYDIKENSMIPIKSANHYIQSKKMAEKLVDTAVKTTNLNAITIRPRGIFGPFDRSLFPRILKAYNKGSFPLIGTGEQLIDITYVDNVAHSLILASKANENCMGQKYNISNGEPKPFKEIIEMLFNRLSMPLDFKKIPKPLASLIAASSEVLHRFFLKNTEPKLTRYTVGVLSQGQTLDITKAKNELNYNPLISIEEGISRFINWNENNAGV